MTETEPRFFETREGLRAWLEANHESADELWVGFYKKASGRPSVTYDEAVEEALCFGWIDGVRYSVDEVSYRQRLTPRRKGSTWSAINIERAESLIERGLMREAGLRAFEKRDGNNPYSQEQPLPQSFIERFQASDDGWQYFSNQAPWYQRAAVAWVMAAKREETRERRLTTLIHDSEAGRRIKLLAGPGER